MYHYENYISMTFFVNLQILKIKFFQKKFGKAISVTVCVIYMYNDDIYFISQIKASISLISI